MLRCELRTQLVRVRTLVALLCLGGVPVAAALALASEAGHPHRGESGLFGASPLSALNHAMACLEFVGPLLLPVAVALLASAVATADRDWGILRYVYVAPVTRGRLLAAQLAATAVATTLAVTAVLAAGTAVFGWHPFHVLGAADLTPSDTAARVLTASGYTLLCMLAMAGIAFALGLLLPRGPEAVATAIGFVVVANILNGQGALHRLTAVLPVHYWRVWEDLFTPTEAHGLGVGALVQLATIGACVAVSWTVLLRRDPAA